MMRVSEGFELRKVGDEQVVITIGDAVGKFNGMIKLNSTGAFIWDKMKENVSLDELADSLASEYSVDKAVAEKDISAFIDSLKHIGCFV